MRARSPAPRPARLPWTWSAVASLVLVGSFALPTLAGEPAPPPNQAPPKQPAPHAPAHATLSEADRVEAGEIGRGLLAADPTVRAVSAKRLAARLDQARDTEAFLAEMSAAMERWANQQERLMEVWLRQAVYGNAEERVQATRLLAALGERAVRRLSDELRHRHLHDDHPNGVGTTGEGAVNGALYRLEWARRTQEQADKQRAARLAEQNKPGAASDDADSTYEDVPKRDDPDATSAVTRTPPREIAGGLPLRYELRDLLSKGWSTFKLRTMLLREADASQVTKHDTGFIVTAPQKGHENLRAYLGVLRAEQRRILPPPQEASSTPAAGSEAAPQPAGAIDPRASVGAWEPAAPTPGPGTLRAEPRTPGSVSPPAGQGLAAADELLETSKDAPQSAAGAKSPLVPFNRAHPQWQVTPLILHLPRSRAVAARLDAENARYGKRKQLLEGGDVVTGSLQDVQRWSEIARRMPDARTDVNLRGNVLLASGRSTRLFSGKTLRYSQDVRQVKGGAWGIVEGTIHHGIEIEIAVVRGAGGLRVDLVAERTDVGSPVPVVTVRPSPQAVPVELERPEWSTTRLATSFQLPAESGGAFIPLEGLGRDMDEQVVLVLSVRPYHPPKQQAGASFKGK